MSIGFEHVWLGPLTGFPTIALWTSNDLYAYLGWGRRTFDSKTLYIHTEQVEDLDGSHRDVSRCWYIHGSVAHLWISDNAFRFIPTEMQNLYDSHLMPDGDDESWDRIWKDAEAWVSELQKSGELERIVDDHQVYQRGGPGILAHQFTVESEQATALTERQLDVYISELSQEIEVARDRRKHTIEKSLLADPQPALNAICEMFPGWSSQVVKLREQDVRSYLFKTFGFTSPRICSTLARSNKSSKTDS